MPDFHYLAKNSAGSVIDGTLQSASRVSAIMQLEKQGVFPITIDLVGAASASPAAIPAKPTKHAADSPREPLAGASLSFTLQHLFTEQLAHLLEAGMPLDQALAILGQRLQHPRLKQLAQELHAGLVEGQSLSQALRAYPRMFPSLYVNLVSAGEASGSLAVILHRLTAYLSAVKKMQGSVQQALVYPAVLVVAGIGLVITFTTVMVPQLTGFFKGTGQPLPTATRLLLDFNDAIMHWWWLATLLVVALFLGGRLLLQDAGRRYLWDRFTWHVPLYGAIIRGRFAAQFARTLGTLTENGITLLRALELLEGISGNTFVRERMRRTRDAVADGFALSPALEKQGLFPPLFLDMLSVGEQTGRLDRTMHLVADVHERQLDKQIQIVTTLIPPIVMLGIAAVVGSVVFAIMSAVFGLTQNLHVTTH